jgi:hypothetical protein
MSSDLDLPPRLRVSGPDLVKPNGKPVVLQGVSFGSWGNDDPLDAPQVAALGANVVRIALRWWMPKPENEARDNDGFAFINRTKFEHWINLITAASAAGMWVIPFIDSNCGQSGTQDPKTIRYCDPHGSWGARGRNFYTDVSMRRVFAQIVWPAAALRLRSIAKIAMLEIHAEPAADRGPEYAPLVTEVQRACIDAIREVDADTPFLLGARGGYNIRYCDEAFLADRQDCVYTGNLLNQWVVNPDKFDEGLAYLTRMRDERGVPVFCQQLGRKTGEDRNLSLMQRALGRMLEERVGFAWWQWKQDNPNPDSYALNVQTEDGLGWVAKDNEIALLSECFQA